MLIAKKGSIDRLIQENKEELLRDVKAMQDLEERMEKRLKDKNQLKEGNVKK